jgi:hypothetical protein
VSDYPFIPSGCATSVDGSHPCQWGLTPADDCIVVETGACTYRSIRSQSGVSACETGCAEDFSCACLLALPNFKNNVLGGAKCCDSSKGAIIVAAGDCPTE